MAQKILRLRDVVERTGLSRSSIYLKASQGQFPSPFKLGVGARASGWLEAQVDDWIAEQAVAAHRERAA